MRMTIRGICTAALLACSAQAHSQQTLVGNYDGSFQFYHREGSGFISIYVSLEITNVAEGKVAGKLQLERGICRGDYSVDGTYEANKLALRTGKGSTADCGNVPMVLALQGNKLIGTYGTSDMELSKK